jgi:hypothetical protein
MEYGRFENIVRIAHDGRQLQERGTGNFLCTGGIFLPTQPVYFVVKCKGRSLIFFVNFHSFLLSYAWGSGPGSKRWQIDGVPFAPSGAAGTDGNDGRYDR